MFDLKYAVGDRVLLPTGRLGKVTGLFHASVTRDGRETKVTEYIVGSAFCSEVDLRPAPSTIAKRIRAREARRG